MTELRQKLKAEIIRQYGSVNEWSKQNDVPAVRFYNFLKGEYNPTVKTLEYWLSTIGYELASKKKL